MSLSLDLLWEVIHPHFEKSKNEMAMWKKRMLTTFKPVSPSDWEAIKKLRDQIVHITKQNILKYRPLTAEHISLLQICQITGHLGCKMHEKGEFKSTLWHSRGNMDKCIYEYRNDFIKLILITS